MLGRIFSVQSDLERAIGEITARGGDASTVQMQIQSLAALMKRVGNAGPQTLASLASTIDATIIQARSAAEQYSAASAAQVTRELADTSARGRDAATSFVQTFYTEKKFDEWLRFSSAQDEEDYRRREAKNKRALEEALAKNTPQGNLEALAIAQRQLADAGEHGADQSPDWAASVAAVKAPREELRQAIAASGGDTSRADAIVASAPSNPLPAASTAKAAAQGKANELDDVLATLQAAGVKTNLDVAEAGHGLRVGKSGGELIVGC